MSFVPVKKETKNNNNNNNKKKVANSDTTRRREKQRLHPGTRKETKRENVSTENETKFGRRDEESRGTKRRKVAQKRLHLCLQFLSVPLPLFHLFAAGTELIFGGKKRGRTTFRRCWTGPFWHLLSFTSFFPPGTKQVWKQKYRRMKEKTHSRFRKRNKQTKHAHLQLQVVHFPPHHLTRLFALEQKNSVWKKR